MGWLSQVLEPKASYTNWDDFWYKPTSEGGTTIAGTTASADDALHVSAFFNGVKILAETVAQPPLILYERLGDDRKQVARNQRLYEVLHTQPNSFQTSYEFRLLQTTSMLLGGNAYAEVVGGNRNAVDELRPLLCGRMRPKLLASGRVGYMYRNPDNTETPYTQDEIFHVRAFPLTPDGLMGQSLLSFARECTGVSLATETYAARLFRSDAKRLGNYSVPGTLTPEQRAELKKLLRTEDQLVLEAGATWVDRGMTARDAEFLLTRKFSVTEWARWLNLPPHLLKDLDRATFANIEHQGLEFLQYAMMPYFINWEQAISRDLIVQSNRFFAEFLVDGLVRADIKTRYEAYGVGINTGFMTRNQARSKENWNRIEGLDAPLVDQNKAIIDDTGRIVPISQPEQQRPPAGPGAHYQKLLYAEANRIMRKEAAAVARAWEKDSKNPEKLLRWAEDFYSKHAQFVADCAQVDGKVAERWAADRKDKFLLTVNDSAPHGGVRDHVHEMERYGAQQLLAFLDLESPTIQEAA